MALTTSFDETIRKNLQKSRGFRRALLKEAVGCMVAGDVETGKSVLRKYINGTIGFVRARRGAEPFAKGADAHVQRQGQSAGEEPPRDRCVFAEDRGDSAARWSIGQQPRRELRPQDRVQPCPSGKSQSWCPRKCLSIIHSRFSSPSCLRTLSITVWYSLGLSFDHLRSRGKFGSFDTMPLSTA